LIKIICVISISKNWPIYISSGGGRGRLAGAQAPARKFFSTSFFVKYLKF